MKLWKISQEENTGYDSYDSAVVAAETEDDAIRIHPYGALDLFDGESWASSLFFVTCEYIGEAAPGIGEGVICASFNAG